MHLSIHAIEDTKCKLIFGNAYSFSNVDRNVELALSAGLEIYANHLLTKQNMEQFDDVAAYLSRKGIKNVRILGLAKQGKAVNNWDALALSPREQATLVDDICNVASKYSLEVVFAGLSGHQRCTHTDHQGACLGSRTFFHIDTVGNVFPCPSVKSHQSSILGTVFRPDEVLQIKETPCTNIQKHLL